MDGDADDEYDSSDYKWDDYSGERSAMKHVF